MSSAIFQEGSTQERAENARMSNIVGAMAVGDLVKSTLGPGGMDKILMSASTQGQSGMLVTNDGATILKSIALDNAAAKVLVNISKVQDDEVGDGTTSVCVLASELLRQAEKLLEQKLHPQTIVDGYRAAAECARQTLKSLAIDRSHDKEKLKSDLIKIAKTTLSSKVLSVDKDKFANICVESVLKLKGSTNLESIQIIKLPGGKIIDSYLVDGFILNKKIGVNQPKIVKNPKILVANTSMDTDKVKIFGARVKVSDTAELALMERAEREKMKSKVAKIAALGINVFVNRQLIYNYPEQLFAEHGIMAIEHADFDGIERLSLVTGGEIASTFDDPELLKLGTCDSVEEIQVASEKMVIFKGASITSEASTIILRGATQQILDEAERSIHDALAVLSQTVNEPFIVYGGGCSEMAMSVAVEKLATKTSGKQALAINGFAAALRQLPTILSDNCGFDSATLVSNLKVAHYNGDSTAGLDLYNGLVTDVSTLGIAESYKLKRQVLLSASEAAEMILRVDDIIRAAPRQRRNY
ncbi:putative T-complex protein 1 subunit beta [Smittium culicis]|uniref:CCT-beta n=1 Tax=Smittium culicis TaxID=133412 RepID=A0A1R1YMQ9_9FUNG|nr:putative T-complex protein 1 subunit beta [Smittium culicis]